MAQTEYYERINPFWTMANLYIGIDREGFYFERG